MGIDMDVNMGMDIGRVAWARAREGRWAYRTRR